MDKEKLRADIKRELSWVQPTTISELLNRCYVALGEQQSVQDADALAQAIIERLELRHIELHYVEVLDKLGNSRCVDADEYLAVALKEALAAAPSPVQSVPVAWAARNVSSGKYGYIWHEEEDVRGWIHLQHQATNSTWHGPIPLFGAAPSAPAAQGGE